MRTGKFWSERDWRRRKTDDNRPTYNFTAKHETIYNAAVAPQQEFEVTPTEVFGNA